MPVREKEGHDIGALGNLEVSTLQLAEIQFDLLHVLVSNGPRSRIEGPAKSLLPYPEAQDIIPINAFVPRHEFLRQIVAEERLKTIDANTMLCHTLASIWHQTAS